MLITEPSDGLLVEVNGHADSWVILVSHPSHQWHAFSTCVYRAPEGESDEVFTVDVGFLTQKCVANSNKEVRRRLDHAKLE